MHLETIHVCLIQHTGMSWTRRRLFRMAHIRQDDGESSLLKMPLLSAAINEKAAAATSVPSSLGKDQASMMWLRMA